MAEELPQETPKAQGAGSVPLGRLAPLKLAAVPTFMGTLAYLGPGLVWAGLAQGSGELIWWPYLTTKYGPTFLWLLIPASLLQFWVNLEIIRYTAATGETILTGFSRLSKTYAWVIWVGIFIENIWFGAYAVAGGTALAALTGFPGGWSVRGQSLFWGYATILIYLAVLLFGRVVYRAIEKFTIGVVVITLSGVVAAVFQQPVLDAAGAFFGALLLPTGQAIREALGPVLGTGTVPSGWDPSDRKIILTSLAFAGAGGFGQFFLGYWMRDKGVGMARYIGRITSPITGEAETIPATGYAFSDTPENRSQYRRFVRYITFENGVGVTLNLITTVLMCWLAWALLRPKGLVPEGYEIAVVQSVFFGETWGAVGRAVFLVVAAAFLCDAWLQATDGFSRVQADFVYANFPKARKRNFRWWYYLFVAIFTTLTVSTMPLDQPGQIIALRGVIAFLAMGVFCPGLILLSTFLLPKAFPNWVKPHPITRGLMLLATTFYVGLGLWYVGLLISG